MNLSFFGLPAVIAGLAAIAGTLFLLQRLRVRHKEVEVITTLFWREALEESRARVFRQRFRHPWVYAFLLAIASLIWFAAAGFQAEFAGERDYLLVLDGSKGAARQGVWEDTLEQLQNDAAELPASQREVWWSGANARLLLQKGEHSRLLQSRLNELEIENSPSNLANQLQIWARMPDRKRGLQVRIFGSAILDQQALDLLPADFEVVQRTSLETELNNRGFLAAGIQESLSGRWQQVDLLASVWGTVDPIELEIDGVASDWPIHRQAGLSGSTDLFLRDLPARGQRISLRLAGIDDLPSDNYFEYLLPNRRPIRVQVPPKLQADFAPLLAADPTIILADGQPADVNIYLDPKSIDADQPALIFTTAATAHTFEFQDGNYADPDQLLADVQAELEFGEIDGLALAQTLKAPVSLGVSTEGGRSIQLWNSLLNPDNGFSNSRAFPLFLARSIRWLNGSSADPSVRNSGWLNEAGQLHHPAGAEFKPLQAGAYQKGQRTMLVNAFDAPATRGHSLAASISTSAATGQPPNEQSYSSETTGLPTWTWLALLAIGLLLLEWAFFHQARLP